MVNPTDAEVEVKLEFTGGSLSGGGTCWLITGPKHTAHNTPGKPRVIDIQKIDGVVASSLKVPALSATVFALPLK